ncbi:probable glutathione S-transferase [Durio zibethinus]|uniref:Glutathione S-transferase n=1 Tax=Durio zibethinus TaxID=66656 RepID=A0A6P5WU62_DURZI|nr:probable glutathione S-transferase [Durio zibethinus]
MAAGGNLKLLGTRHSMFTQRVVWALKLKGIEYEFIEEDLVNKSSLLIALNPVHKKVPILVHGGKPIIDSKIILEYIDETWKERPLFPQHSPERAYVRFWAAFIDDKLMEASKKAFASTGDDQVKAIELTVEALQLLEEELRGKKFFGGDQEIGFLDIVAGWIAYWLQFIEEIGGFKVMDSTRFPCLDLWTKNFLQVPSIEQNLPPPDELRNVFSAIRMAMCPK